MCNLWFFGFLSILAMSLSLLNPSRLGGGDPAQGASRAEALYLVGAGALAGVLFAGLVKGLTGSCLMALFALIGGGLGAHAYLRSRLSKEKEGVAS